LLLLRKSFALSAASVKSVERLLQLLLPLRAYDKARMRPVNYFERAKFEELVRTCVGNGNSERQCVADNNTAELR
jgi:hypothetical protein